MLTMIIILPLKKVVTLLLKCFYNIKICYLQFNTFFLMRMLLKYFKLTFSSPFFAKKLRYRYSYNMQSLTILILKQVV